MRLRVEQDLCGSEVQLTMEQQHEKTEKQLKAEAKKAEKLAKFQEKQKKLQEQKEQQAKKGDGEKSATKKDKCVH